MSDLGNDAGQATLNMTAKVMESGSEIIKYILGILQSDYERKIAKNEYDKIKNKERISRLGGYVQLKKLQETGQLTYAKAELTDKHLKMFLSGAKKRGIPVSYIFNGKNENGKKTYLAVFRTSDRERVADLTDQIVRNIKIEGIDKIINENVHFRKNNFEHAIMEVDGKIIDKKKPVILCERTNPNSYIRVQGTEENYNDGTPYIASEYQVFKDGVKQTSREFKHGKFLHNCDGEGRNSSEAGERHWENIKIEMKDKGGFSDDILIFENEEDYKNYISDFEKDGEQIDKKNLLYNELKTEKENILKDDVDQFNEKQAQNLFNEISGVAKSNTMAFSDVIEHFKEPGKEDTYFICKRTEPNNYIEIKKDPIENTEETQYIYNVYVDGKQINNPHREDGKFIDDGDSDWKNTRKEIQTAGKFDNDCVLFANKKDFEMYKQLYQQAYERTNNMTINFEADKNGLRKDFGYIQSSLDVCKNDIEQYLDLGSYDNNNGTFSVRTNDDGTLDTNILNSQAQVRLQEANVIAAQIYNYQSMIKASNELLEENKKLEAIEQSDLKNNNQIFEAMKKEQQEKVIAKTNQIVYMQEKEEMLWQQREQLTGIKIEVKLRREQINPDKKIFTDKELKEFAKNFKENSKNNIINKNKIDITKKRERVKE